MEIVNIQKEYKYLEHITFSCQYHVIFCTKYRRKIFKNGIELRLKEIFLQIAQKYKFQIIEMEITENYVHLLIDCNPRFDIMNCVIKLKGISSNILRNEFSKVKTQVPTLWTRNAFISTVGNVSLDSMQKYIEVQKKV